MLNNVIAGVFTLLLVVGVPALSLSNARNSAIRSMPRLDLYLSAVVSQWILTLMGWGVTYLVGREVLRRGFSPAPFGKVLEWGVGMAALALAGLTLYVWCQKQGWVPRESDLVYLLMPKTATEKMWAVCIVSTTAAFCEELLFRGFLLSQLNEWLHAMKWAWILSSLAFGAAHCYQGWSGVVRASILGFLLAYPVTKSGSLYPAIVAHWLIDVVALLWLGSWLGEPKETDPQWPDASG